MVISMDMRIENMIFDDKIKYDEEIYYKAPDDLIKNYKILMDAQVQLLQRIMQMEYQLAKAMDYIKKQESLKWYPSAQVSNAVPAVWGSTAMSAIYAANTANTTSGKP